MDLTDVSKIVNVREIEDVLDMAGAMVIAIAKTEV